jgi:uncharacterized membrane protein (GlpM family)
MKIVETLFRTDRIGHISWVSDLWVVLGVGMMVAAGGMPDPLRQTQAMTVHAIMAVMVAVGALVLFANVLTSHTGLVISRMNWGTVVRATTGLFMAAAVFLLLTFLAANKASAMVAPSDHAELTAKADSIGVGAEQLILILHPNGQASVAAKVIIPGRIASGEWHWLKLVSYETQKGTLLKVLSDQYEGLVTLENILVGNGWSDEDLAKFPGSFRVSKDAEGNLILSGLEKAVICRRVFTDGAYQGFSAPGDLNVFLVDQEGALP